MARKARPADNTAPRRQQDPINPAVAQALQQQRLQQQILTVHQQHVELSGPLPPPHVLADYDAAVPGAAARIIAMAEREMAHRHLQESAATEANVRAQQRQLDLAELQVRSTFRSDMVGQIIGGFISAGALAGAVYLGVHGWTAVAVALVSLPIAAVIRALRERHASAPAKGEKAN